jgi:hypothetical protein
MFHQLADLVKVHVLIHVKSHNLIFVSLPCLSNRSLDHPADRHQRLECRLVLTQTNLAEEKPLIRFFYVKTSSSVGENRSTSDGAMFQLKLRTFERLHLH